jgi:hypothetical protein
MSILALSELGAVACKREFVIPLRHELVFENAIATTALKQLDEALLAGVKNPALQWGIFSESRVLHGAE